MNKIKSWLNSFLTSETANPPPKVGGTLGARQNKPLSDWDNNADIISGLEFNATMQLRTPLRVLAWHGRTHSDIDSPPPQVAKEIWEGFWIEKTKTFHELGIDMDEPTDGSMASDIGYVIDSEYLPFLIAVRKIVEMPESIDSRIAQLRNMRMPKEWKDYVDRHGGIEKIIDYFFPRFVDTLPEPETKAMTVATRELLKEATRLKTEKKYIEACDKLREAYSADGADNAMIEERLRLPMYLQLAGKNDEGWAELNRLSARYASRYSLSKIEHQIKVFLQKEKNEAATNPIRIITQGDSLLESTSEVLIRLGLDTPNRVAAATDKALLDIKGIGQAKLMALRNYCASIKSNRDSTRLDNVVK